MAGNPLGVVLSVLGLILSASGLAMNAGLLQVAGPTEDSFSIYSHDVSVDAYADLSFVQSQVFRPREGGMPSGASFRLHTAIRDTSQSWTVRWSLYCGNQGGPYAAYKGSGGATVHAYAGNTTATTWATILQTGTPYAVNLTVDKQCRIQAYSEAQRSGLSWVYDGSMGVWPYGPPWALTVWAMLAPANSPKSPTPGGPSPDPTIPPLEEDLPDTDYVEDTGEEAGLAPGDEPEPCEPGLTYDEASETCIVPRPPWTAYLFIALLAVILIVSAVVAVSFFWGKS